jgi:hypothetical protein
MCLLVDRLMNIEEMDDLSIGGEPNTYLRMKIKRSITKIDHRGITKAAGLRLTASPDLDQH